MNSASRVIRTLSAALLATLVCLGVEAVPASAQEGAQPQAVSAAGRYHVTLAARVCTSFAQVMGNRVRDDRVEAAALPGRTSAYTDGQAVSPDVEAANGNGCQPVAGFGFTFGGGREKKGAQSVVTATAGEAGPTADQTPLLDQTGRSTGKTLAGAVTVALTEDQLRLAMRRELWVQGGTGTTPAPVAGDQFGVLRCGVDGRAGTAVQWVGFPAGSRHVFCFAYYVRGAAAAATLIVRARTTRPVGYPQQFGFDTTASYGTAKSTTIATSGDPADATFVRSATGTAQRVVARVPAGWQLADLSCVKTGAGRSTISTDSAAGRVDVGLAAGETVTCTYSFEPPPAAPAGLTVRLFTEGGGGPFAVVVDGGVTPVTVQGAPAGDGSAVTATGADLAVLPAGAYRMTVSPPPAEVALWTLSGVVCSGTTLKPEGAAVTVNLVAGTPLDCVLRITRKAARITVRSTTVGGVAASAFAVVPAAGPAVVTQGDAVAGWSAVSTTTAYGVPTAATGSLPGEVPFGEYVVTPLAPASTMDGGWRLDRFDCEPGGVGSGALLVTLTPAAAEVECLATYAFVAATRLETVLRFEGAPDGRGGDAVVEIACQDGSTGRVVLAAEDTGEATLPEPLGFLEDAKCTLTRVATGERDGASVTFSAILDPAPGNAPLGLPATVDISRDTPEYTVTITARYGDPVVKAAPEKVSVLDSINLVPIALIGAGLVGIGLVILLVMVIRSRGA